MAEIILPPEENEETPQAPELNIDKPTENSKVITIEFEAKKTNKVSTKDTNQQLYTTDTDAWFEFKETSLVGANGTYSVVFRNRHDGSIFQRTGDVVNGVAYYKIPHQEIRHAGAWRGQIVYTLSNGDTTAREFDYDVKGHILDGKDVREIVVEDFETLMSQLRSMKDNAELELANLTQELRVTNDTAEQNETDRQVFFYGLIEDIDDLQVNYQELLDTGVLQTNINAKLEQLEEEYAPKLTEVTAQLAQKANEAEVRKKSIPINLNDVGSDIIIAIEGGEGATFNLQSIPRFSSVSSEHTTFIKTSSNIIDEKKIEKSKNISSTTGELVESTNTNVTDFVPVTPSDTLIGNGLNYVYYYTYDKVYLSREFLTNNTTFSPPTDANYARFAVTNGNLDVIQVNRGNTLLPYEKYRMTLTENVEVPISNSVKPNSVGSQHLIEKAISKRHTDFLLPSSNLFNKNTILEGKAVGTDGALIDHHNYVVSEFIPVDNAKQYTVTPVAYIGVYDINNDFIDRLSGSDTGEIVTFSLPNNAAKIRLSINTRAVGVNVDETQLNEREGLLPYEEFGYRFDNDIIIDGVSPDEDNEKEIKYTINGVLDKYYEQVRLLPARVRQETDDIYAYYDDLASEYPHYISKEEIGRSVEDRPIYKYSLKLPTVQSPNVAIPKMILTSAIHGIEYMSVETLKHFVNNLVRYWSEDESLETLRWNVEFDIVPLVNPDRFGFDRLNANGVDLNRQFPTGWKQTNTSGSEPLTEPEAIALYNMINSTENVIYYCDGHTFSPRRSEENKWQLLWNNAGTDFNIKHANALMRTVSQKWKQKYDFLPQDETTLFGYVTKISEGGTVVEYVSSLGIEASVFETGHAIDEYDPDDGNYGQKSVSMFTEAFTNWVLINLRNNIRL